MFNFISKFRKNFLKDKKPFCKMAHLSVFIDTEGSVSFCPATMLKYPRQAILGNIKKNPLSKIFNGRQAREIRNNIYNNPDSYCSYLGCANKTNFHMQILVDYLKDNVFDLNSKIPAIVTFGQDVKRINNCIMSGYDKEEINSSIKKRNFTDLEGVKYVVFSNNTDPFSNEKTSEFIIELAQKRPDLKFNIVSNGILFNKENCDKLNITDKLKNVLITVNAYKKETYDRFFSNGDFDTLKQNLYWLKSLKEEGKLSNLFLGFAVDKNNFREMPDFVNFARELNAKALFWLKIDEEFNIINFNDIGYINNPMNEDYEEFVKILNEHDFNNENSSLAYALNVCKEEGAYI